MKMTKYIVSSVLTLIVSGAAANAAVRYQVTLSNASQMPISPAVIYAKTGATPLAEVGYISSQSLIQLCQTGQTSNRLVQVKSATKGSAISTGMPIQPGQSATFEIEVQDPKTESIHFEAMYGKSKDLCAVGSVNSHNLVALQQHVSPEYVGTDRVISTGAFSVPALPAGMDYLQPGVCSMAKDAVSCLRELSKPTNQPGKISFFAGYLPSLIGALESKYGAVDANSLLIPANGGVQIKVQLKH